jgi:hypothetical protein
MPNEPEFEAELEDIFQSITQSKYERVIEENRRCGKEKVTFT